MRILFVAICLFLSTLPGFSQQRFFDDFEKDISRWTIENRGYVKIVASGDPNHKNVMSLQPNGTVYAVIKNSDQWGSVRIEGDVYFPESGDSYLGLVYNFTQSAARTDFGCIYLKGDGSYIQVNPRRDGNASRLLYEEFTTPVTGADTVTIKKWCRFKAEIVGNVCHFYVGNMDIPKIIFPYYESNKGMVGFEPRVTGTPVWVDNVKVTSIQGFHYNGQPIPSIKYEPDSLVTNWLMSGPYSQPIVGIERPGDKKASDAIRQVVWKKFSTDGRGAVITGRVTEYSGTRPVGYFKTTIYSPTDKVAILHFSSVDEIGLYVNGLFYGFVYRQGYVSGAGRPWNAWYDFYKQPQHAGRKVPVELKKGDNEIIIRVRNGDFASGGFFMKVSDQ